MTARRYTTTLSLSLGGDVPTWEGEATVSYEVNPEEPETPPSYSHGGLPSVPAEVVDVTVTHIDGKPVAQCIDGSHLAISIEDHIEASDDLLGELLTYAFECESADHDAAMERRWEERRESRS